MSLLKVDRISYVAEGTKILDEVSLSLEAGELVALVGASGSGKSTLLKICADLISQEEGDLFYNRKHYAEYDPINLRQQISYCVQLPYLFGETVYDNLAFPFEIRKEKPDKQRMKEILQAVNLEESFLVKSVHTLSGGEKQRVALARNLIYTPKILLLDEATSALDIETTKSIEGWIKRLNEQGLTILWITHSLEQSEGIFSRRVTMDRGKIIREERFER